MPEVKFLNLVVFKNLQIIFGHKSAMGICH